MRIDIDHQPALSRVLCVAASVQSVDTCILQLDQRGKLAVPGRLGKVAVRMRSERVQGEHVQLYSGHIRLDRRQHWINGNPGLLRKLVIPDRKSTRLNSSHLGISYA